MRVEILDLAGGDFMGIRPGTKRIMLKDQKNDLDEVDVPDGAVFIRLNFPDRCVDFFDGEKNPIT